LRDYRVFKVQLEFKVDKDHKVFRDFKGFRVYRVHKGLKDGRVKLV